MNIYQLLLKTIYGSRLPAWEGVLEVPDLDAPVRIRRDSYGVPYILAEDEEGAWYGLGFCHGQDRGFQLETFLRVVRGSLSEIFGVKSLSADRLSRRIGFRRAGERHLKMLPDGQREMFQAYVDGINAGQNLGARKRAHEFALLRTEPARWEIADVLGFGCYFGMMLSTWTSKLTRMHVLRHDGISALAALDPGYPDWMFVTNPVKGPAGRTIDRLYEDVQQLAEYFGNGASNNWALDRSRTASGNPILANDPHLAPQLPAPWYLAHLRYPGLGVAGASLVGFPLIPAGFNGTSAWGVTAGLVDGIDLYVEKLDLSSKTVSNGHSEVPCEVLREQYGVRGQDEPFEEEIYITPRGPIVSDVMDGLGETISMKAVWMNPRPVNGLNFHKATTFETCRENFKQFYLASLNVVYADISGTIGWQLIGEAPRRKNSHGLVPMPGWEPAYDWGTDHIPLADMPWMMNPEEGLIATANNQPVRDGEGPYLGRDFIPFRHARIIEVLDARRDWELKDMLGIQLDRFSIPWHEIRASVLDMKIRDPEALQARSMLSSWDGVVRAESAAAAVYEYFLIAFAQKIAKLKAPHAYEQVLGKGFSTMFPGSMFFLAHVSLIARLVWAQPPGWFPEGWDRAVEAALKTAYRKLAGDLGRKPENWQWGDVHRLVLRHPLGARRPLDKIFNRGPYPYGGDANTVAQAGRSVGRFGSNVSSLANLRMAVEVGEWEKNYFVIVGGQSGNPLSPHYDDQLKIWLAEEAISLAWSEEAIAERVEKELVLKPAPER